MIVADHLQKTFEDGFVAVKEATFDVHPHRTVALLGSNGAGKTTTVNMLLGFLPPTGGHALIAGHDVADEPLEAKRHVGYVSENVLLYGVLTAEQNLRFFARIAGKDPSRAELEGILGRVGLGHAVKRRVETFSKGMRQRLGIAIALSKDPPALIMDEPTTGLDPRGAHDLTRLIGQLRDEGRALLVVTHDVHRVKEMADEVVIFRAGRTLEPRRASDVADVEALYREITEGELAAPAGA